MSRLLLAISPSPGEIEQGERELAALPLHHLQPILLRTLLLNRRLPLDAKLPLIPELVLPARTSKKRQKPPIMSPLRSRNAANGLAANAADARWRSGNRRQPRVLQQTARSRREYLEKPVGYDGHLSGSPRGLSGFRGAACEQRSGRVWRLRHALVLRLAAKDCRLATLQATIRRIKPLRT